LSAKNIESDERQRRTHGDDPATMWNPSSLDCDQWAQVCIDSKMAGGWLTTKHHGGFCLWESKHTDYDVASSNVKTDVVREFTDAFRKAGLKIGLYYSILDYHHGVENGSVSREEIEFLKAQVTELLTTTSASVVLGAVNVVGAGDDLFLCVQQICFHLVILLIERYVERDLGVTIAHFLHALPIADP
jgi:alpha-L-fucosidase